MKLEEALRTVLAAGIEVYAGNYSAYTTPFTAKPEDLPQGDGGDMLTAIHELARNAKAKDARGLALETGGAQFSFTTLKGLESVIAGTGRDLHSQSADVCAAVRYSAGYAHD